MTDPLTAAAALTAATVYIARTAYELVLRSRHGANEEQRRCKVEDVRNSMQESMEVQTELLKEIKESQQDTRDGVRELVIISRQKEK